MTKTRGCELLASHIGAGPYNQAGLAKKLGISQPSVSHWVRGSSRPEHHFRIALENLLGIPASTWLTDDEVAVTNVRPSEHPRAAEQAPDASAAPPPSKPPEAA